ncbi:MAG TPA: flagellar basal body protein [Planctomycetaceae bacterium]|nr:flagellar basal body protein [Planctomycetaceae bacterium]
MLSGLLGSTNTTLLKQVARFTERRQEVLAGNIANIDTPGYRLREMPTAAFQTALQRAVAQSQAPHQAALSPGLQSPLSPGLGMAEPPKLEDLFPDTLFKAVTPSEQPGLTFNDANNRSVEHQFLEMTKNSLRQQFAIQVLQGQYDQLQTAISERVG